jgi:hypothetical protein
MEHHGVMHSAFWPGLLTLAMLAGVAAPRQMHLHAANGVRAVHDARHQGDVDQPLRHSHASPHHPEIPAPEEGEPEDVLAVTDVVPTVATPHAPDLVMGVEGQVTLSPMTVHRPLTVHQPPSHAPPSHSAVGPRAPPSAFS